MKIALISPKGSNINRSHRLEDLVKESYHLNIYKHTYSGFGLGVLILSTLTPLSYEIELIDENFEQINFDKKYDLVGITGMTQQARRAYKISDEFSKNGVKTVIGGIHATVLGKEAKKHANSVVIGEAEYIWPELLEDYRKNRIKPFYKSKKLIDMEDSPIPRYDLLKPEYYNVFWVQGSRGCYHDCEFCASSTVYGKKYRHKTVKQLVNEIKMIKKLFERHQNTIQISFADDNLFLDRNFSKKLIKEITPLKIRWFAQTDISIAEDDELLILLQKSGCISLFIGFESVHKHSLESINRNGWKVRKMEKYTDYIRKIQSKSIGVHGSFIVGLDNDDVSVFDKISNFIIKNNLYDTQISICTPLPGTRLRERLKRESRLLPTKWDNYTFLDVNFIHPRLTKKELENGVLEIYKKINSESVYLKKMAHFKEIQKRIYMDLKD